MKTQNNQTEEAALRDDSRAAVTEEREERLEVRGNANPSGTALSIIVLLIAIAFIAFGVYRGEMSVVLTKAVNICLECIGLG